MTFTPNLSHAVGGVAGSALGEVAFPLPFTQVTYPGGSTSCSFSAKRGLFFPFFNNTGGSGHSVPILTAVTGSPTAQNVNISSTYFFNPNGPTYLLVGYGTPNVEIVQATVVDISHVNGIFLNNHADPTTGGAAGPDMVKIIYSCVTGYFSFYYSGSGFSLTNIGFIRQNTLSADVYDFYRLLGAVGSVSYAPDSYLPWWSGGSIATSKSATPVPLYDSTKLSATGNPTNAVVIAAGPITTATSLPNIQLMKVFTSWPEMDLSASDYRFWCDGS